MEERQWPAEDGREYGSSLQLLECYQLAAAFERSEEARELIQARMERMGEPASLPGRDGGGKTLQQSVSEILLALTLEAETARAEYFPLQEQVDELPPGPEKHYLLALLALRKGRSGTQRLEAMRHIGDALAQAPGDPRYRILAKILERAGA